MFYKYKLLNIEKLNINDLKEKVSIARIEKASKYKFEVDKLRSLAVEALLNELLSEYTNINIPVNLSYDEKGRPFINKDNTFKSDLKPLDAPFISLSHSGDYVAALIADVPCGIDIEKHERTKETYLKIAKRFYTEAEYDFVKTTDDFYKIWTKKEAVMKACGLGLTLPMDSFNTLTDNVTVDNNEYMIFNDSSISGYSLAIALDIVTVQCLTNE